MHDQESSKRKIEMLVEKYQKVVKENRVSKYNEEMTKKDFILPLFHALGWNTAESTEVTAEEKIAKGWVDYGFRINEVPKFFLEAKALREDLDNKKFFEQAINYAYYKGCTWAILTNFEELTILNAEWETPSYYQSHVMTIKCKDYIDNFEDLWRVSKDGFEQNLLDKLAEKYRKKTKKSPVDKQLLNDLTSFRNILSKNIMKLNQEKKLTQTELGESIQRILVRLLFIRNCEDRGLEEKKLWEARNEDKVWKKLKDVFAYYNTHYDSKIFTYDPSDTKKIHLCDTLDIDNNTIREIITCLYQNSDKSISYDFSIIGADILGNVYEQYLSHILKKTEKRATITENRGHRKEQGIYYTPTSIVECIVKNTVDVLLRDKKNDIEQIKVLDPACGSASFLIKVFDSLNEHYRVRLKDYDQTQLDLVTGVPFTRKVKILQNNIFGVDLDKQAVEIAQLNLLLKIAEKGHRLPILEQNIKYGNSLIDDNEIAGNKAFKWEKEFKKIIDEKGFDVVIGNPPYFNVDSTFGKNAPEIRFLKNRYSEVWQDKTDILFYFIARSIQLSKNYISFIVSRSFLEADKAANLRKYILSNCKIVQIIDFGNYRVFQDAEIATCIIILQKNTKIGKIKIIKVKADNEVDLNKIMGCIQNSKNNSYLSIFEFEQKKLSQKPWNFYSKQYAPLIERLDALDKIGELFIVGKGMETACNEAFTIRRYEKSRFCRPRIRNSSINRFVLLKPDESIIFPENAEYFEQIPKEFQKQILDNEDRLKQRAAFKRGDCEWYKFSFPLHKELVSNPKIIFPYRAKKNKFALDDDGDYIGLTDTNSIFDKQGRKEHLKFLLGLLNSKLLNFRFRNLAKLTGSGIYEYFENNVSKLPVVIPQDKELFNNMIKLIDKMIMLNNTLAEYYEKNTDERTKIEDEIKTTDIEIDELVYKIYGITNSERQMIEEYIGN